MPFPATGNIHIKALIGGQMRFVIICEMPFTKKAGLIATSLKALCDCNCFQFEVRTFLRTLQNPAFGFTYIIIYIAAGRRKLAGHNRSPGRSTDRACRVGVRKPHPLLGQFVEVRSLKNLIAVTAQITPTHVINKDKQDIGWFIRRGIRLHKRGGKENSPKES